MEFRSTSSPKSIRYEADNDHTISSPGRTFAPFSSELPESAVDFHGLTGFGAAMRQLIQQMQRMAPHLTLATIEGEEGTGVTLAARALHAAGPASTTGAFVPCLATHFFAASEADSSAGWSRKILRQAHGGMLFLDRVHQLSSLQQQTLGDFLHAFDDRRFRAQSGAHRGPAEMEYDLPAQIVFSSAVSLRSPEAGSPSFRNELSSRLGAVRFHLPPLRERREDIPMLAQFLLHRLAWQYGKTVHGFAPGTLALLLRYSWPGNVRELESVLTAATLETQSQWIRPIDLPLLPQAQRQAAVEDLRPSGQESTPSHDSQRDLTLDRAILNHVLAVLESTHGNKLRAALLLGISRSTLYRILDSQEPSPSSPGFQKKNLRAASE